MDDSELIGVVDLGSNSFHLSIVQEDNGRLIVVDRLKEMVQLAYGLTSDKRLEESVRKRALDCLLRFGERLSGLKKGNIRAVGTNTLRLLKDKSFLKEAEKLLGVNIDIVSGREEARLIYLGVAQYVDFTHDELFVMDIGGGSTEFIIGSHDDIHVANSVDVGCVSITKQFFPDYKITKPLVKKAILYVEQGFFPLRSLLALKNRQLIGSSGTIKTVREMLIREGEADDEITLDALKALLKKLIALQAPESISQRFDISIERAQVICGGLIVLIVAFESFSFVSMQVAGTAMREGIMLDLLGRIRKEDMRDRTIESLLLRFATNVEQVRRVEQTALYMVNKIEFSTKISTSPLRYLSWAANLHEIGLAISHHRYYRHGAYLIEHADLDGLSRQDQKIIATIVANHKRRITLEDFEYLPDFVLPLTLILRISVLLHRSHDAFALPDFDFSIKGKVITLGFPHGWIKEHSLINEDLKHEARWLLQSKLILKW